MFSLLKVILFLNKCQLTTFYGLVSVWFGGERMVLKEKDTTHIFKALRVWYLSPSTKCCDFFFFKSASYVLNYENTKCQILLQSKQ